MTTTTKTKADIGCEYIAKHPGCRTPELAEALGVHPKNVHANLAAPIRSGYIVTCQVKRPGLPDVTEFRISATVGGDKAPEWKKFQVARIAEAKQLKAAKKVPPTRVHQHPEAFISHGLAPIKPAQQAESAEMLAMRAKLCAAHSAIEQFCRQVQWLTDGRLPLDLTEALEDLKPLVNKIPAPPAANTEGLYAYALDNEFAKSPEEAFERILLECAAPENAIIVACRPVGRVKLTPNLVTIEAAA